LAARYGLEVLGSLIPGPSSAAEPSARDLAALLTAIQAEGVHAIFLTSQENQSLASSVARRWRCVGVSVESAIGYVPTSLIQHVACHVIFTLVSPVTRTLTFASAPDGCRVTL